MYSKSQIEALALLDRYFEETPESTIKTHIQTVSNLCFVGSSAKDYFSLFQKYMKYDTFKIEPEISRISLAKNRVNKYDNSKINSLYNVLNVENNALYSKHIKPNPNSFIGYNNVNISRGSLQNYKRNNSIFNSIQT